MLAVLASLLWKWSDFESLEPLPSLGDKTLDQIDVQAAKVELVTS